MNNRVTSDSANSVSLFPFLAVLLCTMGALLVLLVVLAQRAGERVLAEAEPPAVPASPQPVTPAADDEAAGLISQLEKVRAYQSQLAKLRIQAEARLQEEQQRLSHLEEHTRRTEHELARLALAAQQLQATENEQSVDQAQAERELKRLQKLSAEAEADLEELREQDRGQTSYAIVPYKGPNGTQRKPIYVECRSDGIILHPEGIELKPSDFYATSWPGNPLAAALRATRDHVNAQAAKAGNSEPPDPYPVILVRPDGIRQYSLVRAAISSWDATFGYEFIDQDWELEFPEAADPLLARAQGHAITLARDRLRRMIRSAPRRFQGVGLAGKGTGGGVGNAQGYGVGNSTGAESSDWQLGLSDQAGSGQGGGMAGQSGLAMDGASEAGVVGQAQQGAPAGIEVAQGGVAGAEQFAGGDLESSQESGAGESGQQHGRSGSAGEGDPSSQEGLASVGGAASSGEGGSAGGASSGGASSAGGGSSSSGPTSSIADSRGRNWAVKGGGRNSVPIRRPIQIVVRENQLALLPNRHALTGNDTAGQVISLNQPQSQLSDEFVAALRSRIDEWGLAGNGLYWRPVLNLNIAPGADQTAKQVLRLLKDSGVEVSTAETARADQGGTTNATR